MYVFCVSSCKPNAVTSFHGTAAHIRALEPIPKSFLDLGPKKQLSRIRTTYSVGKRMTFFFVARKINTNCDTDTQSKSRFVRPLVQNVRVEKSGNVV